MIFTLSFFGLEYIAFDKSKVFLVLILLSICSFVITLSFLKKSGIKSDKFTHLSLPLLFLGSLIGFFVFIPGEILRHLFAGVGSLFFASLIFYIGNLATQKITISPNKYYSLGEINILICAFFSYSTVFGFYLFLNLPIWVLMLQILVVSVAVSYFYFCYNKIKLSQNFIFHLTFGLISCEIAWSLSFWPTGIISRASALFVIFYIISGLLKHYFQKTLDKKVIKEYLVVGTIILVLVLVTTKWTY